MAVTQYGFHEKLINRYEGALNGAITAASTTITVTDATGLPTQGFFRLLIESELIIISSVSGSVLTVYERGAEGTTAATHADATPCSVVATNAAVQEYLLRNNRAYSGAYTQQTSFDDSHAWPIPLNRSTDASNAVITASSFTWRNQGSATLTDSEGGFVMTVPKESGFNLRGVTLALPTVPYAVTARFRFMIAPDVPIGSTSSHFGLWIRDSAGKYLTLSLRSGQALGMWEWTNETTWSATVDTVLDCHDVNHFWLRLVDDNTDHKGYFSIDGSNWTQDGSSWWQQSRTAHLTSGGNAVGFYASSSSSGGGSGAGNVSTGPATGTLSIDAFHIEEL